MPVPRLRSGRALSEAEGPVGLHVQLKRRHDLIPNLVEAVKGYMGHERQTLENVIKARTQAVNATGLQDKAQAENFLFAALALLYATSVVALLWGARL